jgi:hypothetical protein
VAQAPLARALNTAGSESPVAAGLSSFMRFALIGLEWLRPAIPPAMTPGWAPRPGSLTRGHGGRLPQTRAQLPPPHQRAAAGRNGDGTRTAIRGFLCADAPLRPSASAAIGTAPAGGLRVRALGTSPRWWLTLEFHRLLRLPEYPIPRHA